MCIQNQIETAIYRIIYRERETDEYAYTCAHMFYLVARGAHRIVSRALERAPQLRNIAAHAFLRSGVKKK